MCNEAEVKVKKWNNLGESGAIGQKTKEQKHFHNWCQNNSFTPQLRKMHKSHNDFKEQAQQTY